MDGSLDNLGRTHYSLPSPAEQSGDFSDEQAELEDLMEKMDEAYPLSMSPCGG